MSEPVAEAVDNRMAVRHREAERRTPGGGMRLYGEQVLPRLVNAVCAAGPETRALRQRVCSGLSGEVVEIGFGSGLNVPHYPASLPRVAAVEPSDLAWKLAAGRLVASSVPVEREGLDGQSLPFETDTFDSALSTWTMCTIPDIEAALAELRRVLRPGGTLHFIEHGLAPDDSVATWQRRLEPWHKRLAGGCHLTRQIGDLVEQAGFVISELDTFYAQDAPRLLGAESLGVATNLTR